MLKATPGVFLLSLAGISLYAQPASQPIWVVHQVPDDSGVYFVGPEVTAPKLVRVMPAPNREYESGKSAQGITVMALVIGADGVADQIRVLHSHGSSDDQAAMAALKMSNFEPGKIGDKPVPVRVDARVVFKAKQSTAIPEIFVGERDYAAPHESFFEDKKHRPAAYTPPVIVHMVDADVTQPSAGDSSIKLALVTVTVGVNGLPKDVVMRHGLGPGLDEKAIAAARLYRFLPATKNGVPVEGTIDVKVPFAKL